MKLLTIDIEITLAEFFNSRQNIIVPNVFWGLSFTYEIDLLILSTSNYATEVEIKISKGDIKRDLSKSTCAHKSNKIKKFYFAVPDYLVDCEYIPEDVGLISVKKILTRSQDYIKCEIIRPARINGNARKFSDYERNKLLQLGYSRLWTLKKALYKKGQNK